MAKKAKKTASKSGTTDKPTVKRTKLTDRITAAIAAGFSAVQQQQPKVDSKLEPAKTRVWPLYAGVAVAIAALIAVFVVARQQPTVDMAAVQTENSRILAESQKAANERTDRLIAAMKETAKTPAPAPAPGKVQAIEVEVMPLSRVKTDTHAHVLHKQECLGNEGKKVKVRVSHPTVPGLKGWDWYTCPKKTT